MEKLGSAPSRASLPLPLRALPGFGCTTRALSCPVGVSASITPAWALQRLWRGHLHHLQEADDKRRRGRAAVQCWPLTTAPGQLQQSLAQPAALAENKQEVRQSQHGLSSPGGVAQKDLGWKRSLMPSRPTINPALPTTPVTLSQISTAPPVLTPPRDGESSTSLSCRMSSPALAAGGKCWAREGSLHRGWDLQNSLGNALQTLQNLFGFVRWGKDREKAPGNIRFQHSQGCVIPLLMLLFILI